MALAVLAIALGALIKGGMENATNAAYLRDKALADWVAMNRIAEVRLAGGWPETGTTRGTVEMARREWRWTVKISTTFDGDVRRLDVAVSDARAPRETALVHRIGFIGRPAADKAQAQ